MKHRLIPEQKSDTHPQQLWCRGLYLTQGTTSFNAKSHHFRAHLNVITKLKLKNNNQLLIFNML